MDGYIENSIFAHHIPESKHQGSIYETSKNFQNLGVELFKHRYRRDQIKWEIRTANIKQIIC